MTGDELLGLRRLRVLQILGAAPGRWIGEKLLARELDADPELRASVADARADLAHLCRLGLARAEEARLEDGPRMLGRLTQAGAALLGGAELRYPGVMTPAQALDRSARDVADPDVDVWLPEDVG
jgi:hypothetical protein